MITWKKHYVYLADYQHWANDVLFASLDYLDEAARQSPQGLFFDSAHKTVDHILAVNRLWLSRLQGQPVAVDFKKVQYPDWRELKNALRHEVRDMQHWLEAQPDAFFEGEVSYASSDGKPKANWVRDILTHMMTHMVHHRGQVSAVATRLGAPVPEMDFIYYKRETERHLEEFKKNT
jgi:uncharacterized damage-inducible protein DinB